MAEVIFFEKTGCAGNARQKSLLRAAGHAVDARDLRHAAWSNVRLLEFLAGLPVCDWFNRSAPAVKSGEVVPEELDLPTALALLRDNPLLIRRPLMQVGEERRVGFDAVAVNAWIGLASVPEIDLEACVRAEAKDGTYYVQSAGGGAYPCHSGPSTTHAGRCGT